jgi:hypothetical protein
MTTKEDFVSIEEKIQKKIIKDRHKIMVIMKKTLHYLLSYSL